MTHYIEDCEQYEEFREILRPRLFYGTGTSKFSCKLFLGVKVKDELQEYRDIITEVFDQYISNTKRFKTKVFSTTDSGTHAQEMYLRVFTMTSIPESPVYTSDNSAKGLTITTDNDSV